MSDNLTDYTDESFKTEVLESDLPVLVDYWAPWCGPCKQVTPIVEDIAKEYEGKLKAGKLNIDEQQQTPRQYGVRGIPTLMLFKEGQVVETKVGAVSKTQLSALLNKHL